MIHKSTGIWKDVDEDGCDMFVYIGKLKCFSPLDPSSPNHNSEVRLKLLQPKSYVTFDDTALTFSRKT